MPGRQVDTSSRGRTEDQHVLMPGEAHEHALPYQTFTTQPHSGRHLAGPREKREARLGVRECPGPVEPQVWQLARRARQPAQLGRPVLRGPWRPVVVRPGSRGRAAPGAARQRMAWRHDEFPGRQAPPERDRVGSHAARDALTALRVVVRGGSGFRCPLCPELRRAAR
jgi:hypothetical protein